VYFQGRIASPKRSGGGSSEWLGGYESGSLERSHGDLHHLGQLREEGFFPRDASPHETSSLAHVAGMIKEGRHPRQSLECRLRAVPYRTISSMPRSRRRAMAASSSNTVSFSLCFISALADLFASRTAPCMTTFRFSALA
jgi:hypothetical protein